MGLKLDPGFFLMVWRVDTTTYGFKKEEALINYLFSNYFLEKRYNFKK